MFLVSLPMGLSNVIEKFHSSLSFFEKRRYKIIDQDSAHKFWFEKTFAVLWHIKLYNINTSRYKLSRGELFFKGYSLCPVFFSTKASYKLQQQLAYAFKRSVFISNCNFMNNEIKSENIPSPIFSVLKVAEKKHKINFRWHNIINCTGLGYFKSLSIQLWSGFTP